jgi:hypothetical protein
MPIVHPRYKLNGYPPWPPPCAFGSRSETSKRGFSHRQHVADFLRIPMSRIPHAPEAVGDPKTLMVNLARRSRRRAIREDMGPRPGSGRRVGSAYTSRLIEFVEDRTIGWRSDVTAISSDSLRCCLRCLGRLVSDSTTSLNRHDLERHS